MLTIEVKLFIRLFETVGQLRQIFWNTVPTSVIFGFGTFGFLDVWDLNPETSGTMTQEHDVLLGVNSFPMETWKYIFQIQCKISKFL